MIYIICPAHTVTGGTEALYQLGNALKRMGKDVLMVLTEINGKPVKNRLTEEYNVPWVSEFCPKKEDTVIIPEIFIDLCNLIECKRYVWWLSVDNAKWVDDTWKKDKEIVHLVQSHYAEEFLQKQGIKTVWLSDYINDEYMKPCAVKKDKIILFNPSKGYQYISQLIPKVKGYSWVAIHDMTPKEIKELMNGSKLYIDLGHCPGKDRMPREALACGCKIITSKLGGFGNDKDFPIPYKVDNLEEVILMIQEIEEETEENWNEYRNARRQVLLEKEQFFEAVREIFG